MSRRIKYTRSLRRWHSSSLSGNDHPDQNAGARLRFWRDGEVD
jgi:hypothetical protein